MTTHNLSTVKVEALVATSPDHKLSTTKVEVMYPYDPLTVMSVSAGAFTLAGQTATLSKIRQIVAVMGAYTLSRKTATLFYYNGVMDTAAGAFSISGHSADLIYSTGRIDILPGAIHINAPGANLIAYPGQLRAAPAAISIASVGANLTRPFTVNITEGVGFNEDPNSSSSMRWGVNLAEVVRLPDLAAGTPVVVLREALAIAHSQVMTFRPGASWSDTMRLVADAEGQAKYGMVIADQLRIRLISSFGVPVNVADTLGMSEMLTIARGASILEGLGVNAAVAGKATYGVTISHTLAMNDRLQRFLGASVSEIIGLHGDPTYTYRPGAEVNESLVMTDELLGSMLFHMEVDEGVELTDDSVLSMIFNGQISEGIRIAALHVSPAGEVTTWAVNTINNAVTEYTNYNFNSFAQMGNKYLGASRDGLFVLDGNRDGTENIIAHLKSGFASFAGSRLAGLAAIYLGMRGEGDFFLKMEAGDGRSYTYGVKTQPHFMTTKINPGKGLRSRYWRYELIGTGPAFDLDSIEFVPMVAKRRV